MRKFAIAAAMAGSAFAALPANAATIVVNHVLDPSLIGTNVSQDSLVTPFVAGVGDTVEFNLSFTGGQSVTLAGETILWLLALTNDSSATLQTNGTYEFIGASPNIVSGPINFSQTNSFVHIGSALFGSYRLDSDPITFSGIHEVINILSADVGSADPREYSRIALYTDGVVSVSAGVPEPATWALMILGFGLAGGAMRSRQRQTVRYGFN